MIQWLVAYDIPDDARRAKIAKILDGFGDRMQWSVFEITTTPADFEDLKAKIARIVDPEEDALRLYPICAACAPKILDWGRTGRIPFDEPDVIIV